MLFLITELREIVTFRNKSLFYDIIIMVIKMSIIVKETGKTLRSYDTSTTIEVIDRAIGIGMNSLAIVQVND